MSRKGVSSGNRNASQETLTERPHPGQETKTPSTPSK
jgi:hypothetical protein